MNFLFPTPSLLFSLFFMTNISFTTRGFCLVGRIPSHSLFLKRSAYTIALAKPARRQLRPIIRKVKDGIIEVNGTVVEALPDATFKVTLESNNQVIAKLCGRMRRAFIKVLIGDKVKVEMTPYDLTRGRITVRDRTPFLSFIT